MNNTNHQEEYQVRPRNVVLYGESGAGKSSLINLIMNGNVARTSPDAVACTTTHAPYDVTIGEQGFRLWDTAGLNEGSEGVVPTATAKKNLTAFLRGLDQADGVHLLIYCVRGARAVGALLTNYKIFSSVIGDSKVPIVIVVTCLEDFRPEMEEWWKRNNRKLSELGMHFSGYACVTTLKDDLTESPDVLQRRAQSYQDVCELILKKCSQTPHKKWGADINDQRSFFDVLMKKINHILRTS
ncbi:P-loop containing nucleoside triphosphate hydrolase protein [Rhizopogon vinicolor AM-OR11-026]|uniref:p-loop containing nucleoside triphosphate hydrolase protein n=1 Tax=Rhizopogon vinicolor AM-OR11-026 TaxID=1314800 RepID=A0A1B7MIM5_9AGAM|nr:P-loop containing nucleoside triphosphate hydrolase protein [Rhizopogon vinicolor AM-OR11-026]